MADSQNNPAPRVSRYRSQRKAQQQAQSDDAAQLAATPREEPVQEDGVARSRSRYHRRPNDVDTRPSTARPSTAQQIPSHDQAQAGPAHASRPLTAQPSQSRQQRYRQPQSQARQASPEAGLGAPDTRVHQGDGYDSGAGAQAVRPANTRNTSQNNGLALAQSTSPPFPGPQPSGELFPPPRRGPSETVPTTMRADGPPVSGQIRATKSTSQLPQYIEDEEEDSGGCFGLFKRKRGEAVPEKGPTSRPRQESNGLQTIKPGGGGVVPGIDAPVSAVNAGDRRVLVECGKSKTIFPVTPTTTAADLIKSAANCMSERINVHSAVMVEHFSSVGVQRPLRRYEHIRDVLNSWDSDKQNSLLLVDPGTGSSEAELSIAGVPRERPGESSWLLSYSQKVDKWDKRTIILKGDGQLVQQRDPQKPQTQENICHLSDFDIYTPTPEKLKKKVKPPKKICFAVKSQQKTVLFESTINFVSFYCTNDRQTADDFYNAIQGWRSWYLVNVMGEGQKRKHIDAGAHEKEIGVGNGAAKGHRQQESFSSHYQLGSFKPLIDIDNSEKRPGTSGSAVAPPPSSGGFVKSANQFDPTISPERRKSTNKRKQYPTRETNNKEQLAEDEPLVNFARRPSMPQNRTHSGNDEIATTGLLGRSYSQRQREHAGRENQRQQPFTVGPTLLNDGHETERQSFDLPRHNKSVRAKHTDNLTTTNDIRRNQSTRNRTSIDLQRSGSTRNPPKPLIDLTPQYPEPPQHAKQGKGKGHQPKQPGVLIESATSPDDPLNIPPSTDWRGRNGQSPARSASKSGRPGTASAREREEALTGEGLLGGAWGSGKGKGDGGAKRGGPLLDMSEPSQFAQGSLLQKVERGEGRH